MKKYDYHYSFKHGMHCICATIKGLPLEYCGVKFTTDTKKEADIYILKLNSNN